MSSPHLFAFLYAAFAAVAAGSVLLVLVVIARDRRVERRRKKPECAPDWLGAYCDDVEGRACACRDAGLTD